MESHHDARDGTQENGVSRQVGREAVAALQQVPWEHAQADNRSDVTSTTDVLDHAAGQRDLL